MRILGISGSLRSGSHNARLLAATAAELPTDAELVVWDGLRDVPPFDEDEETAPPPGAKALLDALDEADALLVATPEYNSSVPGQLKNALDWASRPFATCPLRNLPVAVIGASTGAFGAVWAQAELRKVLGASGARVVQRDVALGHAHERFDDAGRLIDDEARERLAEVLAELVAQVRPVSVAA
jgi:chromate reductase, NAD(P)H dehydrogenase (quinone)